MASQSETPNPTLSRDGLLSEMISSQNQAIAYLARNLQAESSMSPPPSQSHIVTALISPILPHMGIYYDNLDCDTPLSSMEYDGYDSNEPPKRITIKIKLNTSRQRKSRKSAPKKKERLERYRAVGGVSGKLVFRRID